MLFVSVKLKLLCLVHLKQLDHEIKVRLHGKKIYQADSVKYPRIHLDKYLMWKCQVNNIAIKLNKANAMLSKIGHYVVMKTLKSIYHAIFELHLSYASLVWMQNSSSAKRLHILQKKSLRLMFFFSK